jgi:hypothetical protein
LVDIRRCGVIADRKSAGRFRILCVGDEKAGFLGTTRVEWTQPTFTRERFWDDYDGQRLVPDTRRNEKNGTGGRSGKFDAAIGAQAKLRSKHNTFGSSVVFLC